MYWSIYLQLIKKKLILIQRFVRCLIRYALCGEGTLVTRNHYDGGNETD